MANALFGGNGHYFFGDSTAVSGPATGSTDNAIPLWDGTSGTLLKDSTAVYLSDRGRLTLSPTAAGNRDLPAWSGTTADAVATEIFLAGTAARLALVDNTAIGFLIRCMARSTAGDVRVDEIRGSIKRGVGVGTTVVVGVNITTTWSDAALAAALVTATPDAVNGSLNITVTGIAVTDIDWYATGDLTTIL